MIPPCNDSGNLPPGIHEATWQELVSRFGTTPHRRALLEGLKAALEALRAAGCSTAYIDGSFVTAKQRPNDFDGCWDIEGVDPDLLDPVLLSFDRGRAAQKAKYRGEFFPAQFHEGGSGETFLEFFQVDKETGQPKGIIVLESEAATMIRNVRQYRITKAQMAKLERALQQLTAASGRSALAHPRLQKAQEDALHSQIADLHEQLTEYEALRGQTCLTLTLESFEEFPRALIKARIAAGISQKELAKRLGLKEQQIQRYEATEYASASLARVAAVVRALNLTVREELTLPPAKKSPAETEEGVADAET